MIFITNKSNVNQTTFEKYLSVDYDVTIALYSTDNSNTIKRCEDRIGDLSDDEAAPFMEIWLKFDCNYLISCHKWIYSYNFYMEKIEDAIV